MALPGYPGSVQGWHKLVEREQWPWREVRAKGGKKGLKRLYLPPPEIQALINTRQMTLATTGLSPENRSGSQTPAPSALPDPTDEDRLQMLQVVLRVAESKLKEPLTIDVARKMVDLVAAWAPCATGHQNLQDRLERLRTAAALFLSIG